MCARRARAQLQGGGGVGDPDALHDRRAQLVEMRAMEKNRLDTTAFAKARKSIDKHIAWIDREIKGLDTELARRVADNATWKELDAVLQSIPGVGPQTARTLIGQLPELGHVDRKVIATLVGLAPIANDSGTCEQIASCHLHRCLSLILLER